jgi:hypothetical protein
MQIVINIDEEIYKRILPYKDVPVISNLCNDYPEITHAIANGVPLPKGHGELIDRNDLKYEKYNSYAYAIANAPIIIEADKVESEEP